MALSSHLEEAYARDLPMSMTQYAEPRLVGRKPIRFNDFLSYLYAQQYSNIIQDQYRSRAPDEDMEVVADDVSGGGAISAELREIFYNSISIAVGKDGGCQVDVRIGKKKEEEEEEMDLPANLRKEENPRRETMEETQLKILRYFFRFSKHGPTTPAASTAPSYALKSSTGGEVGHLSQKQQRAMEREATLFYGVRQIPADQPEFISTLYSWIQPDTAFAALGDKSNPAGPDAHTAAGTSTGSHHHHHERLGQVLRSDTTSDVPEYIKNLMRAAQVHSRRPPTNTAGDGEEDGVEDCDVRSCGSAASGERRASMGKSSKQSPAPELLLEAGNPSKAAASHRGQAAEDRVGSTVEGGSVTFAHASRPTSNCPGSQGSTGRTQRRERVWDVKGYQHRPLIKAQVQELVDALVPPRLLEFFDIDPRLVERHYRSRERRKDKIRQLLKENASHHGNKHLLKELQAEQERLESENPIVGEALLIIERASMQQCSREDLVALEREVDTQLRSNKARCWGNPLKMNPQSSNFRGSSAFAMEQKKVASGPGATMVQRPPAALKKSQGRSSTDPPVSFHTVKAGARPEASSKHGGGTATVGPTLNILELSRVRHMVQYHLLGQELLRQVAVDLPERGIFLSRLLNEAELSINSHDILVRESVDCAKEHLLDGQEARAEAVQQEKVLQGEVEELRKKVAYLTEMKRSRSEWIAQRASAKEMLLHQQKRFEEALLERLRTHTEEVKEAQDRERRGSNAE